MTASVPLPVNLLLNLLLDTGLASKVHHPLKKMFNSSFKHKSQMSVPPRPRSALVKYISIAEAEEIYSVAHPTRLPRFLAQSTFHNQEAKSPSLWGFIWSAITLIPVVISYSYMDWEVL